jgi:hypothetical protein
MSTPDLFEGRLFGSGTISTGMMINLALPQTPQPSAARMFGVFFSERNRWVVSIGVWDSPRFGNPDLWHSWSPAGRTSAGLDRTPDKSVNGLIRPRSKDSTEHIFRDKFVGNPRCLQIIWGESCSYVAAVFHLRTKMPDSKSGQNMSKHHMAVKTTQRRSCTMLYQHTNIP